MNKADGKQLIKFIWEHFDMVSQEEYFEFCELVADVVVKAANKDGWAGELVDEFPQMFA